MSVHQGIEKGPLGLGFLRSSARLSGASGRPDPLPNLSLSVAFFSNFLEEKFRREEIILFPG